MPASPPPAGGGGAVWITRASPGAQATAARLRTLGWTPLEAPLIETLPLPVPPPPLDETDALAFSSAAGVRAFAALAAGGRDLPVFAVGAATARAATAAGFTRVRSADGNGADLLRLVAAELAPGARLLHPGARVPAVRLPGARAFAVYETRTVARTPVAARDALARGEVRAVLFHSPSAGRAYAALDGGAPPFAAADPPALLALSPACAPPVTDLAVTDLAAGKAPRVAAHPREADLLALLADLFPPP